MAIKVCSSCIWDLDSQPTGRQTSACFFKLTKVTFFVSDLELQCQTSTARTKRSVLCRSLRTPKKSSLGPSSLLASACENVRNPSCSSAARLEFLEGTSACQAESSEIGLVSDARQGQSVVLWACFVATELWSWVRKKVCCTVSQSRHKVGRGTLQLVSQRARDTVLYMDREGSR